MAAAWRLPTLRLLLTLNLIVLISYLILRFRYPSFFSDHTLVNVSSLARYYQKVKTENGIEVFDPSFIPRPTHTDLFTEFDDDVLNGLYNYDEYIYDFRLDKPQGIDFMAIADVSYSTLRLKELNQKYRINDIISVTINMHDSLGKRILRGGDDVRVWIKEPQRGACANGYVIDHHNGTYTGVVRALWAGRVDIVAGIALTREAVRLLYTIHRNGYLIRQLFAIFERGLTFEMTLCAYTPHLPYNNVCNLTEVNYGLPWYCGHPSFLTCAEWTRVGAAQPPWPLNRDDRHVFDERHIHQNLPQPVKVSIFGDRDAEAALPSCNTISPAVTWSQDTPVGYFRDWKWRSTACENILPNTLRGWNECMSNRRVWMYGDSTMRQWFNYIEKRQNLTLLTERHWPYQSLMVNRMYNYSIFLACHELPFTNTGEFNLKKAHKPAHAYLNELPGNIRDIIVIHLYLHFTAYPPTLLRTHLKPIVQSLKSLLSRAPEVKVVVKGPHAFHDHGYARAVIDDYWGNVYPLIFEKEFKDVRDRVYYLDLWDMTVASENDDLHPNKTIYDAQIQALLGYVCP